VGRVRPRKWQTNIHGLLKRIPTITTKRVTSYFDSIDNKRSLYETFEDAPMLLELAIWKSQITELLEKNEDTFTIDMKMQCCTDSVTMVGIVVPNVLTFLTDGNEGAEFAHSDGDSDDDDVDAEDENDSD
jgi:hypothetical protein